jgi:hypothetical protein
VDLPELVEAHPDQENDELTLDGCCVATAIELGLLREAIERHAPELSLLLTDPNHELNLEESDRLVDAIANELSLGGDGELDDRGIAFDNLIDRVNLGPYRR